MEDHGDDGVIEWGSPMDTPALQLGQLFYTSPFSWA